MTDRLFQLEQELRRKQQRSSATFAQAAAYEEEEEIPEGNRLLTLQQSLLSSELGYGWELGLAVDEVTDDASIDPPNGLTQRFSEAKTGPITLSLTPRTGGVALQLAIDLDDTELTTEFQTTNTRLRGVQDRTKMIRTLANRATANFTWGGVACNILYDPADQHFNLKKEQLKIALEAFQGQPGFALPQNQIDVYCVTSGTSAYSNMSVGFVYKDAANQPNQLRVALILGDSIGTATGTRLLCDDVYDYYKPTFTVDAGKRRALTAIYHEFGHIFHQLKSPEHYFGLANLVSVVNAGASGYSKEAKYSSFSSNPSFKALDDFLKEIKEYGRTVSQYASSHPNEFIAETFSGLMMGVPIDMNTQTAYQALGGAMPTTAMMHVRTGQSWLKRNVLYPIATAIRSIGE